MLRTLVKISRLLDGKERSRGLYVLALAIVAALFETAGVASIMPFLMVLANPDVVFQNEFLNRAYTTGRFESVQAFLFVLGGGVFAAILSSAAVRVLATYAVNRYSENRRHSISSRLLKTYLHQPYEFFLGRHSGDMSKSILSEVDQVIQQVFRPGMQLVSYSIVALFLVALLVSVDPKLALIVGVFLTAVYSAVYWTFRGSVTRAGQERAIANKGRFTTAGEALAGIKDIKLLGREQAYLGAFDKSSTRFSRHQAMNATISDVPKFVIEALSMGAMLALTLYLMVREGSIQDIIPILGIYALAAARLLPAAQQIYRGMTNLRFGLAAVDEIYRDLELRRLGEEPPKIRARPLRFKRSIEFKDVGFRYSSAKQAALKPLSISFPAGTSIGIVGGTGAGKTTFVDILLGLLSPTEGVILVDGQPLDRERLREWQACIGYVPQDNFLSDSSIAENIALGVPPAEIDHAAVQRAAEQAQLADFVTRELPEGYDTMVGERGVRLSGGQRQRIGLARALYNDPAILVLDEATSALDNATERAVMSAVGAFQGSKTIFTVAHRISTVRHCDLIIVLKGGEIVSRGTYEELSKDSSEFRRIASLAAEEK